MTRLIWIVVFLFSIWHSLCAFDTSNIQGTRQSRSLSDIVQKNVDSDRVILKDEKRSKEDSSIYNEGESGFDERKQNSKSYGDQNTALKEHNKGRHSLGESEVVDQGRNSFEQHGNGYYKKGHHRTGFSNSYHKNESGNNSSFYEDSDNERGHRSSENNGGYYGQKSQDSFKNGIRDASYVERDRAQQGMHDNRENYNNYRGYFGGRDDNRYRDGARNYLRNVEDRYHNGNGNEIYYRKEHLYREPHRTQDYMPSYGYSRLYVDTLPRQHYERDTYVLPYSRSYRYLPNREDYYGRQIRYPVKEYFGRSFQDDPYDTDYLNKYDRGSDFYHEYRRF